MGTGECREGKSCAPLNQPHVHPPTGPISILKPSPSPSSDPTGSTSPVTITLCPGGTTALPQPRAGKRLWYPREPRGAPSGVGRAGASSPVQVQGAKGPLCPSLGPAASAAELCRAKGRPKKNTFGKNPCPRERQSPAPRGTDPLGAGGRFSTLTSSGEAPAMLMSPGKPLTRPSGVGSENGSAKAARERRREPGPASPAAQPRPRADALQ